MHSWYAMHCVKNEHIFARYYDRQYDFIQVIFLGIHSWVIFSLSNLYI